MLAQMFSLGGFLMLLIGILTSGFFMGLWSRAKSKVA